MLPHEELSNLRKSGQIDEAYERGKNLLENHPNDRYIKNIFGWVLHDKVKRLVESANQSQAEQSNILENKLRELLVDYYRLDLSKPDLLFSRLIFQALRFPGNLSFFPKFVKWAGIDSFSQEDFKPSTGSDGKVYKSLIEKTAIKVGKIVSETTSQSSPDTQELRSFAIALMDAALERATLQEPEWLNYRKALLLRDLGRAEEAQSLLIRFIQRKRSDFWSWRALSEVVEASNPALALSLCAKAYLTCHNLSFGIGVFEDLSRLAVAQHRYRLAKWSANQAFRIRNENGWRISQSLRDLLDADWYKQVDDLPNPEEALSHLSEDAERIIWASCPRYKANYLGTFSSKSGKTMLKVGLSFDGEPQEVVSPARELLKGWELVFGDPVTVVIDEDSDRRTVVAVEKREAGTPFDSMSRRTGQIRLTEAGFGFMDDIHIPKYLGDNLESGQIVSLVFVKKLDKKRNRPGLSAIAILDEMN